jgi:hypothetical protein
MANLIGKREDIKASASERLEIIRLTEAGELASVYKYLIERINEYEIAIWDDKFFSDFTGDEMTLNHLTCMLRRDVVENSGVGISNQVAGKITSWLLKALISCCVESGSLELDASVLLNRIDLLSRKPTL